MTSERQFEALLRSWLDASAPSDIPQGLLESVVTTTAHTRPRPAWLVRLGGEPMPQADREELNRFAPLALAGTALIVAVLIGISLLVGRPDVGPPHIPSPSPSATAEPSVAPTATRAASWTATGNMTEARSGNTATLLADGKVLVTGGDTVSAELYDPASGTWTATGKMIEARSGYTATLLTDGRVLVAGGGTASAELYDPVSGTWTATGNMVSTWFRGFTATRLVDGRVLVAGAGGSSPDVDPAPPELYDPVSGTWTATGPMVTPRSTGFTATLLADGRVLVAGGGGKGYLASAEVYDPASGTWTATGDMAVVRGDFTASLLNDGSVLVVGGLNHNGGGVEWASAELYDPVSGSWTATGTMGEARYGHTATLLRDGRVLVAGGLNTSLGGINGPLATAELYDSSSASWSPTANLVEARGGATATTLSDGTVLVAGGFDVDFTSLTTAELYDPGSGS
jgi:N-acetylneuraminic acid mutarotase